MIPQINVNFELSTFGGKLIDLYLINFDVIIFNTNLRWKQTSEK